jgi:hypothetical protein
MTEMRGLSVEEEIATRLLTGVPFEQVTPLSFWELQAPALWARPTAERAATTKAVWVKRMVDLLLRWWV